MNKAYFNYKCPYPPGKSKFQHGILDRNDQNLLLVSHSNYPGRKVKKYCMSCQVSFTLTREFFAKWAYKSKIIYSGNSLIISYNKFGGNYCNVLTENLGRWSVQVTSSLLFFCFSHRLCWEVFKKGSNKIAAFSLSLKVLFAVGFFWPLFKRQLTAC